MTSVTAATVISVAASRSPRPSPRPPPARPGRDERRSTGGGAFVVSGSAGQAIMTGTPWHVAVIIGALLSSWRAWPRRCAARTGR